MTVNHGWSTMQKLVFDTQQIPVFGDMSKCLENDSLSITVKLLSTVFPVSYIITDLACLLIVVLRH